MKHFYLLKRFSFLFYVMLICQLTWAQGVTTGNMNGQVTDQNGEGLPGTTIMAIHESSGTQYGTTTNEQGRYNLPNMRVGAYTISVSFVGFETREMANVNLRLGQTLVLNFDLQETSVQLGEVEVRGVRSDVLNSERTGAATSISSEQVQTLPTITRGFNDFTRLTPQADIKGAGISIGGMNNRFNQVTIDGAVSNDVFGLSESGTNGGQTGTSPISIDAIEEFQVVIAPYDVRLGGFAGGGISAITRSGTNDFSGSAYYFFRNESLAGKTPTNDPDIERERFPEFTDRQYGVRIGGPIIKNKLFFFVNVEQTENVTPLSFAPGTELSEISVAEAERVAARARALGYDPGGFLSQESTNESEKIFGRLDWNVSNVHKLTFRHSYTKGQAVGLSRSPRTLTMSNGAVLRESTTNSTVAELNSRFSNAFSNNLIVGYSTIREPRSAPGAPFPRASIRLDANRSIFVGTEPFSTVNQLEQDILTLTNNLNYFTGKHAFTFGTHNEFYDIYNAFIGQAYGDYQFRESPEGDTNPASGQPYTALENWERGMAQSFTYQYSKTNDPREGAKFRAMQLGFYVQDEFQASKDLKLTAGVRLDIPIYLDNPLTNEEFNNSSLAAEYGVKNDRMPKPALMFSPRIGFNWDAKGDRTTQVRGGTGIFTSRFPFVWAGGAFTQSGVLLDRNQVNLPADAPHTLEFIPDPQNQPKRSAASGPGGNMTVIDENFKLPQIFRTNIAVDQQLPWGLIGTLEAMFAQNLNSFSFTNINLVDPVGRLQGADNRLLYPASDKKRIDNYGEIIYIDNVNKGSSYSLTAQLQKSFEKGFYGSLAYTYTRSKDLYPGTSSQNHSNYYRVASVNGSNNLEVGSSPFDSRSRIVGALSYRKEYLNSLATTISLFYNGQSGTPFSYVVAGDLNRSTFSGNIGDSYSLIYIPRDQSEITFVQSGDRTPQQQWNDFNAFIESQDYLKNRRGEYAERNGARTPFTHQFDLKILQDIFVNIGEKRNTLQLSIDIFNVGNLLNKKWGQRYSYEQSFFDNTFRALTLAGYDGNTPQYRFNPVRDNEPWTISDAPIGGSRWVGQIGIRYLFN